MRKLILIVLIGLSFAWQGKSTTVIADRIRLDGNYLVNAVTGDTICTWEAFKDSIANYVLTSFLTSNYWTGTRTNDSIISKLGQYQDTTSAITGTGSENQMVYFTGANTVSGNDSLTKLDFYFDKGSNYNLCFGYSAYNFRNTIGAGSSQNNAFSSIGALGSLTTGAERNNAFGSSALASLTTGDDNSAFGTASFAFNITGSSNTGVGYSSGYNSTGSSNTYIGKNTFYTNTSGSNNIGIGNSAGYHTSTLSNWLIINSLPTASESEDTARSIIAGYMNSNASLQRLRLNAKTYINQNSYLGDETTDTAFFNGQVRYQDTFWDDLQVPATTLAPGSNAPSLRTFLGGIQAYAFNYQTADDYVYGQAQLKHSYKAGTDVRAHCHISIETTPAAGDSVYLGFEYTWANIGDVFPTTDTLFIQQDVSTWAAKEHHLVNFGALDGTGMIESSVIMFRFIRKQSDSKDTYDSAADWMFLNDIDFHFEIDKPGSNDYIPD